MQAIMSPSNVVPDNRLTSPDAIRARIRKLHAVVSTVALDPSDASTILRRLEYLGMALYRAMNGTAAGHAARGWDKV